MPFAFLYFLCWTMAVNRSIAWMSALDFGFRGHCAVVSMPCSSPWRRCGCLEPGCQGPSPHMNAHRAPIPALILHALGCSSFAPSFLCKPDASADIRHVGAFACSLVRLPERPVFIRGEWGGGSSLCTGDEFEMPRINRGFKRAWHTF